VIKRVITFIIKKQKLVSLEVIKIPILKFKNLNFWEENVNLLVLIFKGMKFVGNVDTRQTK